MLGGTLSLATASQGGQVAWVVPTYKNGRSLWRWAENMTGKLRAAGYATANKTDRIIEFTNGGQFGIYSADNEDSIRGEAFHLVILDEAARISETAWTDAIQPTLADYDGDAFLISTPKGINWFHAEWIRGRDAMNSEYAAWQAPSSHNPNPKIQKAAQLAIDRVPARTYQQEWLAQFIADGAYFQGVNEAAIIDHPDMPEQHKGHAIYIGVDWALTEDYTVLTVGCRECNRVVDWERFNQIDYTYQREKLKGMAQRWNAKGVLPERNSIGEPNIELLREHMRIVWVDGKMGFATTATSKPGLIQGLAMGLEHNGFKVPRDYADELRSYQVEMGSAGNPKFSAPQGYHDDRVISLALCYRAMTTAISSPFGAAG